MTAMSYEADGGNGGGVLVGVKRRSSIIAEKSMTPVTVAKMAATTMAATTKNAIPTTGRFEPGTTRCSTELGS